MTGKDLFFVSSAWNTGTGFCVNGYDFIITSVQTVGFSKKVTVRNLEIPKTLVNVLFVDYSLGLAFLEKPCKIECSIDIVDFELAIVEQIVNVFRTNYYGDLTVEKSDITDKNFSHNNIPHLLLDGKFSENCSGAMVLNAKHELVGITKFHNSSRKCLILPARYLLKAMEEYSAVGGNALRCTNCYNVVSKDDIYDGVCPVCATEIMKEVIEDTLPKITEVDKKIEKAIDNLGYDLQKSRLGLHLYEINEGSASIFIRYDPETKFLIAFSMLCKISEKNREQVFDFLLKENAKIDYLSFSLNKNRVFLSTPYLIEEDFDEEFAKFLFDLLFKKADYYDDVIMSIFQ